ncbi:MAG: single-stranded DNA-binding protein [Lachnospiraceae bacterium]|nr:single-stranded DNA-binding protein [Lachnospiraceae bacterium]MBR3684013.1 single-stranded DNA-binding protein [Lachnospiraceae bacterium]
MTDKVIENNQVTIMGEIVSDFTFSHEIFGEGFYMVDVRVVRLSDSNDIIPLMVSERLVDVKGSYIGEYIAAQGQFRSYNRHEERKNRLVLSVFVRELEFIDEEEAERCNVENAKTNQIYLDGYICKDPIYRKTPLGREIADLLLAVNRPYGKSDYIPCICWGRNARFASGFEVGTRCEIWGRIQSREYMKKLSEDEVEKRVAYEVSVSKLELLDPDEE